MATCREIASRVEPTIGFLVAAIKGSEAVLVENTANTGVTLADGGVVGQGCVTGVELEEADPCALCIGVEVVGNNGASLSDSK